MKTDKSKLEPGNHRHRRRYETTNSVHKLKPDFSRPPYQIPAGEYKRMNDRLEFIYGSDIASQFMPELERLLQVYHAHKTVEMIEREKDFDQTERFSEEDVILITYGDLIKGDDRSPLTTLSKFCGKYLNQTINTLHILPFFPSSSDRGFSVMDFEAVDPHLGGWADIEDLEGRYQLMFDGVINHVSSQSRWFQEFLNHNMYYRDFFIAYNSPEELSPEDRSMIFRPRTSDILTRYEALTGPVWVWTTFSDDQIDLNYKNPNVLMRVIEILLHYIQHGADIIRLDAVTYLWCDPGTPCIHLDKTHEIVKLFRDILNTVAPTAAIITETNVPHEDNISYFGNGHDEAQMVYNFALPPLVLHTFYTGDCSALAQWAAGLDAPSETTTFFNFLDSHDGIGVMAVKNILDPDQIDHVVQTAVSHGALISYKTQGDGTQIPYEINMTWFSALNRTNAGDDLTLQVKRFVASRAIALVLAGVPGIYLHGLIGSQNDIDAVKATHVNRSINRTVIDYTAIMSQLENPYSKISRINKRLSRLLTIRTRHRAFHPNGPQQVLFLSPNVFSVVRRTPEDDRMVLCLINVTSKRQLLEFSPSEHGLEGDRWVDLILNMEWAAENGRIQMHLAPYSVVWLEPIASGAME